MSTPFSGDTAARHRNEPRLPRGAHSADSVGSVNAIVDNCRQRIADSLGERAGEIDRISEAAQRAYRLPSKRHGAGSRAARHDGSGLNIGLDNVNRTIEGKAAALVTSLRGASATPPREIDAEAARRPDSCQGRADFAGALAASNAEFASSIEQTASATAARHADLARSSRKPRTRRPPDWPRPTARSRPMPRAFSRA